MCGKRRIVIRILLCCFLTCLWGIRAFASEEAPEDLPEIIRWECGGGYDSGGNRIRGVWAYDTTGQAGKYVLFDENGMVQKKADNWENRDQAEEYYTPTEQDSGTIALRSEVFAGFDGEILVTMESENGVSKEFVLSADNLYETNVPAPGGVYRIQNTEAADSMYVYTVEYPKEWFQMEKDGLHVLRMKLADLKTGEVKPENMKDGIAQEAAEDNQIEYRSIKESGGKEEPVTEKIDIGKKTVPQGDTESRFLNPKILLTGVILLLILAVGFLIRNHRKIYQ